MSKGYPLIPVSSTGDVQGGRQRSPHMTEGKLVPYLRVANVFDGYIDFSDVNEMAFKSREIDRFRLLKGDILLNEGQSVELVGRCAMFMDGPEDCCYQNTLVRYRAGPNTDPHFALQLFRYCQSIGIFSKIAVKTNSIAHLGVSRFAELELPFPAYQTQVKIARILDRWDTAIQKTEQLIAAKTQRFMALRERLVASPGKHISAHTDVGRKTMRFGDIFSLSKEVAKAETRLEVLSVTTGGIVRQAEYFNKPVASEDKSGYLIVRRGQLVMSGLNFWMGAIDFQNLCEAGIVGSLPNQVDLSTVPAGLPIM